VRQEIRDSTRFAFVREDLAAIAFCIIETAGVAAADLHVPCAVRRLAIRRFETLVAAVERKQANFFVAPAPRAFYKASRIAMCCRHLVEVRRQRNR